jgi:hypothetical protein
LAASHKRVAWFGFDRGDTPNIASGYLSFAFRHSGLGHEDAVGAVPTQAVQALLASVERDAEPWLLVLDDIDPLAAVGERKARDREWSLCVRERGRPRCAL